ncbi:MAG: DMT family transporter, partial [Candidatus Zixiibacteriota bacterium]
MANLILLTVVVLWGVSFVGTKMALAYLTPVEVVTIRILLALPVLRIVLALKKGKIVFTGSDYKILLTASLILGVHFLIQAVGLNYTTATNTSWLIATIPVFIAGTSYIFLRERLTFRKIGGIAIAAAGVVLLV